MLNDNNIKFEQQEVVKLDQPKITTIINPKSIEEVKAYFQEKGSNKKEGEKFYYFYESKGWKVGKESMKNWKMAASGWISRNKKNLPDSDYLGGQLKAMRK